MAGSLTAEMLMRGTKKHTREQLKDELDRLKAQLRVGGDATNVSISLEVEKKNLAAALALVREVLREPTFDAKEFEQLRQSELAQMEESKSQPQTLGQNAYEKHIHPWPKGHPYDPLSPDETIVLLKAVKLEDVKTFYRDFYGADASEISVVGDFDEKTIDAFAKATLVAWNAKSKFERIKQPYQAVKAETITIKAPEKANAFFMAGLPLEVSDADVDYPALVLGNYILGGGFLSSRLGQIRTRDGLSYGVGSFVRAQALDKSAVYTAYAIYAPENRAALEKVFDAEMKKALVDGFTEDELKAAKTGYAQARQVQRGQDSTLASMLLSQTFNGRTFAFDAEMEAKVAALDLKTIAAALKLHLTLDKLTKVFAGDFDKKK